MRDDELWAELDAMTVFDPHEHGANRVELKTALYRAKRRVLARALRAERMIAQLRRQIIMQGVDKQ